MEITILCAFAGLTGLAGIAMRAHLSDATTARTGFTPASQGTGLPFATVKPRGYVPACTRNARLTDTRRVELPAGRPLS